MSSLSFMVLLRELEPSGLAAVRSIDAGGTRRRSRSCTSPPPANGGRWPAGDWDRATESPEIVTHHKCPRFRIFFEVNPVRNQRRSSHGQQTCRQEAEESSGVYGSTNQPTQERYSYSWRLLTVESTGAVSL
ncbi:hypothetical protein OS493_039139 [Desmophyllum pertusum]|uniref:Uncharacterized protein n=1 Tax=Desmophyllum pertusum TaxID=174260 RepID=A0A9W9ZHH3_9CNID|nr:hypothetical protein OS493_039139 [Desmophyllum pertusum]